ncbi:hypothetical protein F4604DRAFT_1678500 [Suillus subluteus]|nr:hypothetical protein F4604DRAFT_1678500 [Suillus subluteus]
MLSLNLLWNKQLQSDAFITTKFNFPRFNFLSTTGCSPARTKGSLSKSPLNTHKLSFVLTSVLSPLLTPSDDLSLILTGISSDTVYDDFSLILTGVSSDTVYDDITLLGLRAPQCMLPSVAPVL